MLGGKKVQAVVLAAGSSQRYGKRDKLYEPLNGVPLLCRSVETLLDYPAVDGVILVVREDRLEDCRSLFAGKKRLEIISGGNTRCASALLGIRRADCHLVLTHDGARPFLTGEVITRCLEAALETGGAAAGLPAVDTVKVCDESRNVLYTTPRRETWLIQSPQAFWRPRLLEAYAKVDPEDASLTDDCMVMERAGFPVRVVPGDPDNFKITGPGDYRRALNLCGCGSGRARTGIGQDSHRFEEAGSNKPLILGGVLFPEHRGLAANSDGDVVLHALCNAISGITCENVLGARADAICSAGQKDSSAYVREAMRYLHGRLTHLSFTIECRSPIISPRIPEMRKAIGGLTGLPEDEVGITATSGEGLTDFGRGEGISVFCIATAWEVE